MDESEIELGKKYRDTISGFEGVAVARHEYLYGCTRITLQCRKEDGGIMEYAFDSPALVDVETDTEVTSERTGGPDRHMPGDRSTG